jgi:hypothetical protein
MREQRRGTMLLRVFFTSSSTTSNNLEDLGDVRRILEAEACDISHLLRGYREISGQASVAAVRERNQTRQRGNLPM